MIHPDSIIGYCQNDVILILTGVKANFMRHFDVIFQACIQCIFQYVDQRDSNDAGINLKISHGLVKITLKFDTLGVYFWLQAGGHVADKIKGADSLLLQRSFLGKKQDILHQDPNAADGYLYGVPAFPDPVLVFLCKTGVDQVHTAVQPGQQAFDSMGYRAYFKTQ